MIILSLMKLIPLCAIEAELFLVVEVSARNSETLLTINNQLTGVQTEIIGSQGVSNIRIFASGGPK